MEGIQSRINNANRESLGFRVGQVKSGITQTTIPESIKKIVGNKIVNISIVPWMRSQTITVTAKGLKPSATMYPFFDRVEVGSYCTPNGGNLGDPLVTDINGNITLTFDIPQGTFLTGEKLFRLTDSNTDSLSDVTTATELIFRAQGLLKTTEEGIVSTRVPFLHRESVH